MPQSNSISIQLNGVAKKFNATWIFRGINAQLQTGNAYAITGPNGSGKSTLLKIIAGIVTPNKGTIDFKISGKATNPEDMYRHITFCAPYMDLPEEMNLAELLSFHTRLRPLIISTEQLIETVQIEPAKEIRNYSSGMKQRVKLALAFYTQTNVILLDEPTGTLDDHWTEWYLTEVQKCSAGKLLVISSNHQPEYSFCNHIIDVESKNVAP
jgi:ABC-type multidrug transport system ATPase subunit